MLSLINHKDRIVAFVGTILCCAIQGVCWAQPPRGPKSPKGPPPGSSEFWKITGEAIRESNHRAFFGRLVAHPAIQAEIGLSDQECQGVDALNSQHLDELRKFRSTDFENLDRQASKEKLVELMNQQDKAFNTKLKEAADFERLIQISIQVYGHRSVLHDQVATRIGLSQKKLTEIRQLAESERKEELDRVLTKMRQNLQGGEEFRDLIKQVDDKVGEAIKMRLTAQQLLTLNELKGVPFDIPADLYDRRYRDGRYDKSRDSRNDKNRDHKDGRDSKDKDDCARSCRSCAGGYS